MDCPVEEKELGSVLDPFVLISQMLGLQVYSTMSGSSSYYIHLLLLLKALDEYIFFCQTLSFLKGLINLFCFSNSKFH